MAYKFYDHKEAGEDHLVSKHMWHNETARPPYELVAAKSF